MTGWAFWHNCKHSSTDSTASAGNNTMPRATIASRQLKNKDTGLDLIVPSYRETKGLMSSTVYYQVVLVSNLACFKTPNHKESEVVQYSIEKQWNEFEELRIKAAGIFHGTSLPLLNKISIMVNEQVLRQRRNSLDQLMKFMASVPILATCAPLLQFLGVDSGRAKRFTQSEPLERSTIRIADDDTSEGNREAEDSEVNVFENSDVDQADDDLFDEEIDDTDEALFESGSTRAQVSMFEQQDMKAELTEEDEKDFGFIPDAIVSKKETMRIITDDTKANADLLIIEDDLDKLMSIDVSKPGKQFQQKDQKLLASQSPQSVLKPNVPAKPSLAPKPAAKPSLANTLENSDLPKRDATEVNLAVANKPKPGYKPQRSVGQTPAKVYSSVSSQKLSADTTTERQSVSHEADLTEKSLKSDHVGTFDQDDILKYLCENASTADDGDLFS